MKHIIIDSQWSFTEEPFPMFRCELIFGRNKRDRKFIPTKVQPEGSWTVSETRSLRHGQADDSRPPATFFWKEEAEAEAARRKALYAADPHFQWGDSTDAQKFSGAVQPPPTVKITENPLALPEGKFQVIKTREKGTIMIVPGEDKTNRLLLMTGVDDGFRGGSAVDTKHTTANVISECAAGAACEGRVDVAAILSPGDVLVFRSYGRYWDRTTTWSWDGTSLTSKVMPTEEAFAAEEEAAGEVL